MHLLCNDLNAHGATSTNNAFGQVLLHFIYWLQEQGSQSQEDTPHGLCRAALLYEAYLISFVH
jgi:hypothetical protein